MIGLPELIVLLTLLGIVGGIIFVVRLIMKSSKNKNNPKARNKG